MKKHLKIIIPLFMVVALSIGGTFAVLQTQTEKVTNTFEFEYSEIKIEEPNFVNGDDFYPNKLIKKDPMIENVGTEDVYVYMSVFIPDNLFTFDVNSEQWSVITSQPETIEVDGETRTGKTYYYNYNQLLKPNEKTTSLFDSVKFIDFDMDIENQLEDEEAAGKGPGSAIIGRTHPIIVNGYALTSDIHNYALENAVSYDGGSYHCKNTGPAMYWNLFLEDKTKEYADGESKPAYLTAFADIIQVYLDVVDREYNYYGTVELEAFGYDTISVDSYNLLLSEISAQNSIELRQIQYAYETNRGLDYEESHFYDYRNPLIFSSFNKLTINPKHEDVYVYVDSSTEPDFVLEFENGTQITNESLAATINNAGYDVVLSDEITINETANNKNILVINVQTQTE